MKKLFLYLGVEDWPSFWRLVKQFLKFSIVGVINTLIYMALYYIFLYFGLYYLLANVLAYVLSIINSFLLNKKFVFKVEGSVVRRLVKVFISYGITMSISSGLMYVLVDFLNISEWIAPYITFIVTIPVSFLLQKLWAFKR